MGHWFSKFLWTELMITNQQIVYVQIIDKLKDAGISYREKIQYIGNGTRRGGLISGLGENRQYIYLYQIFVKKCDIDRARYICKNK